MLNQRHYHEIADEFQTNVGKAEWTEPINGIHTNVSKMPDGLKVAILTQWIVQQNIYQQVIREVIRLESKYKNKRIKGSTIYEKAIDNIVERDSIVLHY
jgi:hypothetical protein